MSVSLSYKNTQRACVGVYQIIISFCKQYFSDYWRANSILLVLVSVCVRSAVVFIWYREQGSKEGGDRPGFAKKLIDQVYQRLSWSFSIDQGFQARKVDPRFLKQDRSKGLN